MKASILQQRGVGLMLVLVEVLVLSRHLSTRSSIGFNSAFLLCQTATEFKLPLFGCKWHNR